MSGAAGPLVPAGQFSSWLRRMRTALANDDGIEVPCGECNACCRSSYFIHVRPEETQTLARIPEELLFPAPGLPEGNVLLGFDDNGHCPMLVDGQCSIYEHRPLTCRSYDCRVFAAAGIAAGIATGGDEKALVDQRVGRWEFTPTTTRDRSEHTAVRAAARFLRERADCFPAGVVPGNPTQLAILAIKVHEVFLKDDEESGETGRNPPDLDVAKAVMEAMEKLGARNDEPKRDDS